MKNETKRSEAYEQTQFFNYVNEKILEDFRYKLIFAVPNGGRRDMIEAVNLKRQGVRRGVPDVACMIPNTKYYGLFIEFKVGTNKPSEFQIEMMTNLESVGYLCEVCYSSADAIDLLENYLNS